jgi:hypothetical protein
MSALCSEDGGEERLRCLRADGKTQLTLETTFPDCMSDIVRVYRHSSNPGGYEACRTRLAASELSKNPPAMTQNEIEDSVQERGMAFTGVPGTFSVV